MLRWSLKIKAKGQRIRAEAEVVGKCEGVMRKRPAWAGLLGANTELRL